LKYCYGRRVFRKYDFSIIIQYSEWRKVIRGYGRSILVWCYRRFYGGGGLNVSFPAPLPSNIGQVLKDALKDEIVNTTTGLFIEEKINETRKTCND
jgi:hypothetical protein